MDLSLLVFTQLFSKVAVLDAESASAKTEVNVKQSVRVTHFGINCKRRTEICYIIMLALSLKFPKK